MKKLSALAIMLSLLMLCGCATLNTLDRAREAGKDTLCEEFSYPYEEVFGAAKETCTDLGLALIEANKSKGLIYVRGIPGLRDQFWGTGERGELIGVYLTKTSSNSTKVEVTLQKIDFCDSRYHDYKSPIINGIKARLE